MDAKASSKKDFDTIANDIGVTNSYAAQLFMAQAQLKPETAVKLRLSVASISDKDLLSMQQIPFRSFDASLMQEPMIYRLVEAIQHYGQAIKMIVNEKKGDGIISAIDFYMDVKTVKGKAGEDRIVLTMNGKFLPFVEQLEADNTDHTK
ncbi:cyanate lyase C-terminal domain-containing protein [Ochromonadaceae sp. CCMP2298]|nr:cyanate lyase C-terminal domain-containing protein [Ochromonadaceae sp. CCMP2298]